MIDMPRDFMKANEPLGISLITTRDVCRAYNVTDRTVANWREAGLRFIRVGRMIRYKIDDVRSFIESRRSDDLR